MGARKRWAEPVAQPAIREVNVAAITWWERGTMTTRSMAIIAITATVIALVPIFAGRAVAQESSSTGASGWFQDCRPAAVGNYDPLLAFGQPGGSHMHNFYGNEAASPFV